MSERDEGLLVGPLVVFDDGGLLGGLVVPGEWGFMEVLEAYLEFLVDKW